MAKFLLILCFIIGLITKLIRGHLFDKLDVRYNLDMENKSFEETIEDIEELAKKGNTEAKIAIIIHRINLTVVIFAMVLICIIFAF